VNTGVSERPQRHFAVPRQTLLSALHGAAGQTPEVRADAEPHGQNLVSCAPQTVAVTIADDCGKAKCAYQASGRQTQRTHPVFLEPTPIPSPF